MPETAKPERLSASLEDYIEAIYNIASRQGAARVTDIAAELGVAKSSVTGALRTLSEKGLINYDPYSLITLKDEGLEAARKVARRHSILEHFLSRVLALDAEVARENACSIEHVMDSRAVDRLLEFIEFLEKCPRAGAAGMEGFRRFHQREGSPVGCLECVEAALEAARVNERPPCETGAGFKPEGGGGVTPMNSEHYHNAVPLVSVPEGRRVRMVSARCGRGLGSRLASMGLRPGVELVVVRSAGPGPLAVALGNMRLALGRGVASRILVVPAGG